MALPAAILRYAAAVLVFGAAAGGGTTAHAQTQTHTLRVGNSTLAVHIDEGDIGVDHAQVIRWVRLAADAMVTYYGRYPVERAEVFVRASPRGRVTGGRAYGGRRIVMTLGPQTRPSDLDEDWRMAHEMVHLSFPDVDRRHLWMTEGVATYVESIARARAGQLPAETVWWWLVTGLPKGLPGPGDRGLDDTSSWGRIYWGGAMYFFLADMMIRRRTENRRSIDDALRAILEAGGNGGARWPVSRVVAVGDRATGTTVMSELYGRLASRPATPDLASWFRKLGVHYRDDLISFDEDAPLSHLRRAVTAPDSPGAERARYDPAGTMAKLEPTTREGEN